MLEPEGGHDDGYAALVVGVPSEDVQNLLNAGAINVIYANLTGLSSGGNQFWHQDSTGILDDAEDGDFFGRSLAAGDFNGDGYLDLAASTPAEGVSGMDSGGAVNVLYGTADGLSEVGNQFWHQDSPGITDTVEQGDGFGVALAAGDFNGDGFDDLAIGVTGENVSNQSGAGAVNVIYGSMNGLSATGNQFWHQDSAGIIGAAEADDRFGSALTAGDFDGDMYDDLVVGVPKEDFNGIVDAGVVNVIYGSATGLTAAGDQVWHQDTAGILDTAEQDDFLGSSLETADFDKDGYMDLVIGVSSEDINGVSGAGAVNVLYGTDMGLASGGNQFWHQDSPGIPDDIGQNEAFGFALETADFDGDGFWDLSVGVPSEEINGVIEAGALHVLFGSNSGLSETGTQFWHQESPGILDNAEASEYFGSALAGCDFNGDGFADLAASVPDEEVNGIDFMGAVNVLYGTGGGLSEAGNQFWHQDSPGILDDGESGDFFGISLACMDGGFSRVYMPGVFRP